MPMPTMHTVIEQMRIGKHIEAIKTFRQIYGAGLKEAKEACDAIRVTFLPHMTTEAPADYITVFRYPHDTEFSLVRSTSLAEAMVGANETIDNRDEAIVAKVVAKSVVKRTMEIAA
ncbi:hypothetical protein [Bradyrhizobium sp. SZCCHNS3053]|uniref:hypothetical protein n=1 Tax=Bradyrhizobium sp. SZCCHNS3053 TaxID=3057322 RepID=UPI002916F871|nr:hypothetical protein [Bradyrhizobium sp. SZCCHNS3053]